MGWRGGIAGRIPTEEGRRTLAVLAAKSRSLCRRRVGTCGHPATMAFWWVFRAWLAGGGVVIPRGAIERCRPRGVWFVGAKGARGVLQGPVMPSEPRATQLSIDVHPRANCDAATRSACSRAVTLPRSVVDACPLGLTLELRRQEQALKHGLLAACKCLCPYPARQWLSARVCS